MYNSILLLESNISVASMSMSMFMLRSSDVSGELISVGTVLIIAFTISFGFYRYVGHRAKGNSLPTYVKSCKCAR